MTLRDSNRALRLSPGGAGAVLLLTLLVLAARSAWADSDLPSPAVQQALDESSNGRFAAAKKRLAEILSSPSSSARDRDEAGTEVARIEWRIDDRPDAARKRLEALIPGAARKVPPLLLLSRMERSLRRFDAARAAARRAMDAAETNANRESTSMAMALALVGEQVLAARTGDPGAYGEAARSRLTEALALIAPRMRELPGPLSASAAQLDAALLLDDGPRALEGWRSYYAAAGTADSALLAGPRAALSDLLPRWKGSAATRADREALVRALADSRCFTEAVIVAKDPRVPEEARVDGVLWVKDLIIYESYVQDIRERTDAYYRTIARENPETKAWKKDVTKRTQTLWSSLSWPHGAPPFDPKALDGKPDTPLGERFGTLISLGETGKVINLHIGHRVVDTRRAADQYGRHATIRFIALDAMVSNGYQTWMWDGSAAHGGWGDVGLIVQVRSQYAEGSLREWQEMSDPERRAKADERMAQETARDDERAAKDPYANLPGLAQRLRRQGTAQILDGLRARGVPDSDLRATFVEECDRAKIESSIFAHEGRHAIDAEFEKPMPNADLEYRAKLSEIAFAPVPRLAFGGILNASIGSGTPHGQANLKLVKGLVAWMEAHRAEIAGLDGKKPLLPQLDALTDDQLRAAARSLDPMAASGAKDAKGSKGAKPSGKG